MKFPVMSIDEALELLGGDSRKLPELFQYMINNAVTNHQGDWPLSSENWKRFVEDVNRFNEHYGFSLQINLSNKKIEMNEAERIGIYVLCGLIIILIAVVLLRGII